ncbi:MAG: glycosyltransferase family 4 protein [Alphaproteobacteria bacterium]|nr:glycosyltransferase family 4 protein [Alphaproteobacteria bacterium]
MRIAFYAPLKAPDDPVPSGDRRMARLLIAALARAGHEVEVISRLRAFDGAGDVARQEGIRVAAEREIARILAGSRPDLFFTYHLYYKAPDWIGPAIADRLAIPYVVAEPAFAPKRAKGPWAASHAQVARALARADAALTLTTLDAACVGPALRAPDRLVPLPPFLDSALFLTAKPARTALGLPADKAILLAVGMMREGPKTQSYLALAAALRVLPGEDWVMALVGDGPSRGEIATALRGLPVVFLGAKAPEDLPSIYASADLYVWPAVHEAYGMALLEAQAAGLPVIAGRERGVPDVVMDGRTGVLVPPDDPAALAGAVRRLLDDRDLRERLGRAARDFVRNERHLDQAARTLDQAIDRALRP